MHITPRRALGNSQKGKRLEDKKHQMITNPPFKLFKILFYSVLIDINQITDFIS